MALLKKFKSRRGFTLAELMIVIAIIAILAGIAFAFIDPKEISYVEYNRSAEAIATAVQNRLTEIRNSGDMAQLRTLGEQASASGEAEKTALTDETAGGYRYVFNYSVSGGEIVGNADIAYLLPFGAIDYELAQNYYAIGFQSDTGMVKEVFYSVEPFAQHTVAYLLTLSGADKAAARKAANVGYYEGVVYDEEIAFANLPTPQLTITNYEELTLSIYLPEVKQLKEYGKQLGILVSLSDEDGEAYSKKGFTFAQTAIYSTFSLGSSSALPEAPSVVPQTISSGATYNIVLDTVQDCSLNDMQRELDMGDPFDMGPPKGVYENWAKKTQAFKDGLLLLGDNAEITVTVYCLYQEGEENYNANFPINPTFMPRSASTTFNGWFNNYKSSAVEIACGRHLQNLAKLADLRPRMKGYLPTYTVDANGVYTYGNYNYGMADAYTYENSHSDPPTSSSDIQEKYDYRDNVKHIKTATQVNAIDFDCKEWKDGDGKAIPFTPICLPSGFNYYGNYLTINHLYVNSPYYAGLFGYANKIELYDILLVNPSVTSQMPAHVAELYEMGVGALIGTSRDSDAISNCQAYMTQENGSYHPDEYRVVGECYVGGLIGFCEDEHIKNCSASVYTGYQKGAEKKVPDETATGTPTTSLAPVSSKYVGGLIGAITGDSELEDCYAAGNLSGVYVGGLVGLIMEDSDPSGDDYRIETCYTAGHIEYAEKSAAGILGYAGGYGGNPKSSLNINRNYCVVIYGEKNGSNYEWHSAAPIYGTFEGDGFEWIQTHDFHYGDDYLKGRYAGFTYFAGASFENRNKNYYIAQRGITYSNSPYYNDMKETVLDFLQEIKDNASNRENLLNKINEASEKIVWLKKLEALDKLKELMERIIYEVDNEAGIGPGGRAYNKAGFYEKGEDFYLDLSRARVEGKNNETGHTYSEAMTLVQVLHAMYDGTYTDDAGNTKSVTMLYKGSTKDKSKLHETYKFTNYTFMDYYNFLQKTYQTLLNDSATEAEKTTAREALTDIFGDNTKEIAYTTEEEDNGETVIVNHYFYQQGLFYQCFCSDLLHRLFDKAKDYYETDKKDKTGEIIYRYYRDLVTDNFYELLCDIGMSASERDKMLENVKISNIQEAIDAMAAYPDITAKWTGPMKDYATEAKDYAAAAKTALKSLLTKLEAGSYTVEEIQPYIDDAIAKLDPLYTLLDAHKSKENGATKDPGDWDAVDSAGTLGDMRNLRDPISNFRRYAALCIATANSGVENALKVLKTKAEKTDTAGLQKLVDEFTNSVNIYLSAEWGYTDSGYRLYNSTQLRNAARGFIHGDDSRDTHGDYIDTRENSLGFMYDYGNSHSEPTNPYYSHIKDGSYVDQNNGIYNNVFPYIENEYTHYYPFPFVYGREVENLEFEPLYVLFHYGDWLTDDLWADPNRGPINSLLDEINAQLVALKSEMDYIKEQAGKNGTTGNIGNVMDALGKDITKCETAVENALSSTSETQQKEELAEIRATISAWLAEKDETNKKDGGLFIQLKELCESHLKKEISANVLSTLEIYEETLSNLVTKIDELIGT